MKLMTIAPRATEKTYLLSGQNVYVFSVPLASNKNEIAEAIEKQFNVSVESICTLVQSGKAVRYSRGKRAMPGKTVRSDVKKAYVTLKKGDSIRVFDEPAKEETK